MLDADPSVATGPIEALATVGDHRSLAAFLDDNPDAVNDTVRTQSLDTSDVRRVLAFLRRRP